MSHFQGLPELSLRPRQRADVWSLLSSFRRAEGLALPFMLLTSSLSNIMSPYSCAPFPSQRIILPRRKWKASKPVCWKYHPWLSSRSSTPGNQYDQNFLPKYKAYSQEIYASINDFSSSSIKKTLQKITGTVPRVIIIEDKFICDHIAHHSIMTNKNKLNQILPSKTE